MAKLFWTREKLEWMRQTALPQNTTLRDALRAAEVRWNRKLSTRPFETQYADAYGQTPGCALASEREMLEKSPADNPAVLRKQIKMLEKQLKAANERSAMSSMIRDMIHDGKEQIESAPDFLVKPPAKTSKIFHGVPTLFLSDVHYAERVFRKEVNGCNEYDTRIARDRIQRVVQRFVYMLDSVLVRCEYPGAVLALGGDMVSGNIHEELRETNEVPIAEAVVDLVDILRGCIDYLLGYFPRLYVPCVCGNHGRLDKKPRAKHGQKESYEYFLYQFIRRAYAEDPRVVVEISDSAVHHYKVYHTRYALSHGDQFKGGAGISGIATPIALGDHKLRKQMAAIESWTGKPVEYDVLLLGHFHQLNFMRGVIMNGSVKGFDEYAKKSGFAFEPPQQAMWLTHPTKGVSIPMPVFCEDSPNTHREKAPWIEILR